MKGQLIQFLKNKGYQVTDVGAAQYNENDDYPDYAREVAVNVSLEYENSKGILICGSGVGVNVVANKYKRIRCGLVSNPDQAFDARNDDDTNVLALASDYTDIDTAKKIVLTWLETPFSGEQRHSRRLKKVFRIEGEACQEVSRNQ